MAELSTLALYSDGNLQENYKLEDLTGKNGNTLTNNNSATFPAAKYNNGVSGGSSDADKTLSINSNLGYTGGAYSISFWVKINTNINTNGVQYSFLGVADSTSKTAIIVDYQQSGGVLLVEVFRVGWNVGSGNATYSIDLGTTVYHHFVVTYDGTTLTLYIDGVSRGTGTHTGNGSGSTNVTNNFVILGQTNVLTANNALAIIDDVALFNRVLSSGEVTTIFNDSIAYTKTFNETLTLVGTITRNFTRIYNDSSTLVSSVSAGFVRFMSLVDSIGNSERIKGFLNGISARWTKDHRETGIWTNKTKPSGSWSAKTKTLIDWSKIRKH